MFKNRKLTVTMDKNDRSQTPNEAIREENFEKRTQAIVNALQGLGAKMFLGVVIYIILDTRRQVEVAKVTHKSNC